MIIFDTNIETTVRILEYCEDDVFEYKELESLQINDNRRIDLSVLLYLKAEKVDAPIELILNLIYLGKEKKLSCLRLVRMYRLLKGYGSGSYHLHAYLRIFL